MTRLSTSTSLACAFLATTLLVSSASLADPIRSAQAQRDWHDNDHRDNARRDSDRNQEFRTVDNRHWDNDRHDDHHDDHDYRGHSNTRVIINNRNYYRPPYYHPYHGSRNYVYYEGYPDTYYYSSAYYTQRPIPIVQNDPYVEVRCTQRPITGTIVGGAAGGLIGNQFGHGRGRTAATLGGVLLGAIIGNNVDRADESCAYQALEYAQPNTQVAWVNPNRDYAYTVTPGPISEEDGRYCREYQAKVMVGGRLQDGYGRACRQPDGSWEVVD